MRRLKSNDYLIAGFGIWGALQISGLTGKYILFPGYMLVLSLGIVSISIFLVVSKRLANILTAEVGQAYVIYIVTNSLPGIVFLIRRILT